MADAGLDAAGDGAPHLTLAITVTNDVATTVVPGAALKLAVVILQSDGTTAPLPTGSKVTWSSPATVGAADPSNASDASLPYGSGAPLAFFITNAYRPDRSDYDSVLFVVQRGTTTNPNVTVTATVGGLGAVTAYVPVRDPLDGDADAGSLDYVALKCNQCHGATGAGSPPETDGGSTYLMQGASYPYPAPALNAGDAGGIAADPAWNAAYFGLACQGGVDNNGVALRKPMPDFLGPQTAQDFANIYAFMRTQR